jgi:hypothetical protein
METKQERTARLRLDACKMSLHCFRMMYKDMERGATTSDILENEDYWPLDMLREVIAES